MQRKKRITIKRKGNEMSNKLVKKPNIDWNIHAVLCEDGTTNIHTHGLEKRKLTNLEWICPNQDKDWINWAASMINDIVFAEIEESRDYRCGRSHLIDSVNNYDDVQHVFYLEDTTDEYGDHVHMIEYPFNEFISHPDTGKSFFFSVDDKKWKKVFVDHPFDNLKKG